MSDYIVPNGPFIQACRDWVSQGFALTWMDRKAATQPEKVQAQQAALKEAGVVLELSPPPVEALPATLNNKPLVWEPPPKAEPTCFKHLCPMCQQDGFVVVRGGSDGCQSCLDAVKAKNQIPFIRYKYRKPQKTKN